MDANGQVLIDRLQALGRNIFAVQKSLPVLDWHTDPWRAWRQWRLDHGLPVSFMDGQDRWTVPTEYPPVDLDALEIEWQQRAKSGLKAGTRRKLAS